MQLHGDKWFRSSFGLSYAAYYGNGDAPSESRRDANENKAIGGRLTAHLNLRDRFTTLDVSVSGYAGDDRYGRNRDIWGVDTQIRIDKLELLAEFAHSESDQRLTNRDYIFFRPITAEGFYVQLAYQFQPRWTVFYRFDELDLDANRASMRDAHKNTLGFNFKPRPNISLKLEGFHMNPDGRRRSFNGFAASAVYYF